MGSPPGDLGAVVGAVGAVVGGTAGVAPVPTPKASRATSLAKHQELDLPNVCSPENVSKLFSSVTVADANWYYLDKANNVQVCVSLATTTVAAFSTRQ